MAAKANKIVLDSWSVLAFLQGEKAAPKVADAMADVIDRGGQILMCVVNLGEVWYVVRRNSNEATADRAVTDVLNAGVSVVEADWVLTRQAGVFKARGGISYADAYAAALAKVNRCELLTGDPEFKTLEAELGIAWV